MSEVIGRIGDIRAYPVKSMGGISLDHAYVGLDGIVGDRLYGFRLEGVDSDRPSKQYLTARDNPFLFWYKAFLANQEDVLEGEDPLVLVEDLVLEKRYHVTDPELKRDVEIMSKARVELERRARIHDQYPLSFLAYNSVRGLSDFYSEQFGSVSIDPMRFRMNFLIDWDFNPLHEHELIGSRIQIGKDVIVSIDDHCKRCVMMNWEDEGHVNNPQFLKSIGKYNQGKMGVYGSVISEGIVDHGDPIMLHNL